MKYYNSKYTGKEVDERLDKVDDIPSVVSELDNDIGYITKESADQSYERIGSVKEVAEDVKDINEQVSALVKKVEDIDKITWIDVK